MEEEELIPENECGFCRTVLKPGATVCSSCGANKRGKPGCGCVVASAMVLSGLSATVLAIDGYIGPALGAAGVAVLLVAVFRFVMRPMWYRENL